MALKSKSKPKLQLQQQQHRVKRFTGSKQTAAATKEEVYPIHAYLKSPETARMYTWHFNTFLKYLGMKKDAELLQLDPKDLESKIIKYLVDYMSIKNHRKKSTVETAMHAIFSFCTMNDIFINRKKIAKLIPPDENHKEDRSYTHDEIAELFRQSTDERFRAVILLMANGIRVGGIPTLELRDLIPKSIGPNGEILDDDTGAEKLYQIWVYNRSTKHRYYMFVTPECRIAIDKYLAYRASKHENLSIKTSPLIRTQFDKEDANKPRKLSVNSIKKTIERTIQRARLSTKGSVAMTHGLRKFAISQMIKAKVDYEVREYVSGHRHSRGLDTSYDRLTPNERLEMWAPAINLLTIDKSFRLDKELKVVEGKMNQKIAEQEQEIARLKAKEHEDSKALGELSKEFNEMKYLLGQLSKKSQKQLVNKFHEKVGDKADIEWSCD